MRLVVTGASGFLGQALIRYLSQYDLEVIGVSRKASNGVFQVDSYADTPYGDVLVHLAETNDRRVVESAGISYQLAAQATVENLLKKGYRRFIYASSALLYGDQNESSNNTDDPVSLIDMYTRSKFEVERAVLDKYGVIARLTNVYGPGMSHTNVLSEIFRQLPLAGPLKLSTTFPVRDFIWVNDAAEAIYAMAMGTSNGVFNVGTGEGTSIGKLARIVLNESSQNKRVIESLHSNIRPSRLVVNIEQTCKHFHWRPALSLAEGIKMLSQTFRN